jgi:NitT/TauT family transport system permease protein
MVMVAESLRDVRKPEPQKSSVGGAWVGAVRRALARIGWTIFSLAFFASLWEIAWAAGWTNPRLLPPPHIFLGNFVEQAKFFSPTLRWQVGVGPEDQPSPLMSVVFTILATTARVLAGLLLATVLSISLGVAIRRFIFIDRLILPTVTFLAPVSPIAWLPIAIFLFGIGNPPAIFMVFIALFFTMTLATIAAIDGVNRNYINVARTMGATPQQIYWRVVIPAIAPGLLVVLRMNMFAAWMVVLLAEATGVGSGLGQIIMLARNTFNPSLVFFTITIIGILGFLSDLLLRKIQERFLFWAPNGAGLQRVR